MIAVYLCFLSLLLLSLTISRHRREALPVGVAFTALQNRLLQLAGFTCLLTTTLLFTQSSGWGLGLVYLTATVTGASLLVSLLLSLRPQWLLKSWLLFTTLILLALLF